MTNNGKKGAQNKNLKLQQLIIWNKRTIYDLWHAIFIIFPNFWNTGKFNTIA